MNDTSSLPPVPPGHTIAGPEDAKVLVDGQWVGVHTVLTLRQSVIHTQRAAIESMNAELTTLRAQVAGLEAAMKAADQLIRRIDAYPPEISCTNQAVRAFHTDAKYMAAAWLSDAASAVKEPNP